MPTTAQATLIKDRVQRFERIEVAKLRPHPQNWRQHTPEQREAVNAAINEIGFASVLVVRPAKKAGTYQILDGHLRADKSEMQQMPCIVVDLDDEEAAKFLATFDPLAGMATVDEELLRQLSDGVTWEAPELSELVNALLEDVPQFGEDDEPDPLDELKEKPKTQCPECGHEFEA